MATEVDEEGNPEVVVKTIKRDRETSYNDDNEQRKNSRLKRTSTILVNLDMLEETNPRIVMI